MRAERAGRLPVVGITGPYCSGKSTLAGELEKSGWVQIEVDELGHASLDTRKTELVDAFSQKILDDSGAVDRRKLGSLVFADGEKLKILESIVHPEMKRQTENLIAEIQNRDESAENHIQGILVNAAILFHMQLHHLCDFVFWIHAPRILRFFRARKRDGLSFSEISRRFSSQRLLKAQLAGKDADIYRVENLFKGFALQRIRAILQVKAWSRTKHT